MRSRDNDASATRGNGRSSRFVYTPRSPETVQKRATQSGGNYDTFFDSRFIKFTAEAGYNCIRILPPGWPKPVHFGYDYWLHSQIGPDNSQYLCLEKSADLANEKGLEGGRCPICEERRKLEREGETDEANQLRASHRVGVWIIDRNNERDGPKFYDMSWSFDKDIAALQINKRTGEAVVIDDPDHGYDFEFQREGKGLNTRYIGKQIARQSSPISDDPAQQEAWWGFTMDHPIPDVLNFFPYDYLVKVFTGAKKEDDDEPPPRRSREREEARPQPRSRAPQQEETDDPPFDTAKPEPRQEATRARVRGKVEEVEEEEDDEEEAEDPVPSTARQRLNSLNERNTRRG